jgi:hypothetical protein
MNLWTDLDELVKMLKGGWTCDDAGLWRQSTVPCVEGNSSDLSVYPGQQNIQIGKIMCGNKWSVTLREENRLRVFENRVLRRIFGPKRDEVAGEWIKLHSEELHILYSFPNIIRQIKSKENEVGGTCGTHGRRMCTGF